MSFNAIKGHQRPIEMLKSYLAQSRLEGGYLFSGPEGVGKKLIAIALAKAVNCEAGLGDSCGQCASCRKIEKNQHPDLHLIEPGASDIKIEQIRQLQHKIGLRPYEARMKVFIIDNAHQLTAEAAGALLKVLEEPPGDSLIILISDKPSLLFKTIISRCKVLKFAPFERERLKTLFREDFRLDNNTAHFLAYFSEGRLGCGLRLKEADTLREKNNIIDEFVSAPNKSGFNNLPSQQRQDIRRYMNILAGWLRDIYLLKMGLPYSEAINLDRSQELVKYARSFSVAELNRMFEALSESLFYLERNINIKLILYNLKAQLCSS
ncbi:MAG: DNA polymerase III subunit delta' [Candidatus Omnitrophota bacterium]